MQYNNRTRATVFKIEMLETTKLHYKIATTFTTYGSDWVLFNRDQNMNNCYENETEKWSPTNKQH